MELVYEILLGLVTSIIGLLIALLINSAVENRKERRVYKWMLEAIKSEAKSNWDILHESFLRYFENGVVVRAFSIETTRQHLGNPMFVKHARRDDIEKLNTYLRHLSLHFGTLLPTVATSYMLETLGNSR